MGCGCSSSSKRKQEGSTKSMERTVLVVVMNTANVVKRRGVIHSAALILRMRQIIVPVLKLYKAQNIYMHSECLICVFSDPVDAVYCSMEIEQLVDEYNSQLHDDALHLDVTGLGVDCGINIVENPDSGAPVGVAVDTGMLLAQRIAGELDILVSGRVSRKLETHQAMQQLVFQKEVFLDTGWLPLTYYKVHGQVPDKKVPNGVSSILKDVNPTSEFEKGVIEWLEMLISIDQVCKAKTRDKAEMKAKTRAFKQLHGETVEESDSSDSEKEDNHDPNDVAGGTDAPAGSATVAIAADSTTSAALHPSPSAASDAHSLSSLGFDATATAESHSEGPELMSGVGGEDYIEPDHRGDARNPMGFPLSDSAKPGSAGSGSTAGSASLPGSVPSPGDADGKKQPTPSKPSSSPPPDTTSSSPSANEGNDADRHSALGHSLDGGNGTPAILLTAPSHDKLGKDATAHGSESETGPQDPAMAVAAGQHLDPKRRVARSPSEDSESSGSSLSSFQSDGDLPEPSRPTVLGAIGEHLGLGSDARGVAYQASPEQNRRGSGEISLSVPSVGLSPGAPIPRHPSPGPWAGTNLGAAHSPAGNDDAARQPSSSLNTQYIPRSQQTPPAEEPEDKVEEPVDPGEPPPPVVQMSGGQFRFVSGDEDGSVTPPGLGMGVDLSSGSLAMMGKPLTMSPASRRRKKATGMLEDTVELPKGSDTTPEDMLEERKGYNARQAERAAEIATQRQHANEAEAQLREEHCEPNAAAVVCRFVWEDTTRLYGPNHRLRVEHLSADLIYETCERWRGRLVEPSLCLFEDPSDALAASVEVRIAIDEHNALQDDESSFIPLRGVGVDLGEILQVEGTDMHWGAPVTTAFLLADDAARQGDLLITEGIFESTKVNARFRELSNTWRDLEFSRAQPVAQRCLAVSGSLFDVEALYI